MTSPDPHFDKKLASIKSLEELSGFHQHFPRPITDYELRAIVLKRTELQKAGVHSKSGQSHGL